MDDTLLRKAENILKLGKQADEQQELTAAQKLKHMRDRDKAQRKILQRTAAKTKMEQANAKIANLQQNQSHNTSSISKFLLDNK